MGKGSAAPICASFARDPGYRPMCAVTVLAGTYDIVASSAVLLGLL